MGAGRHTGATTMLALYSTWGAAAQVLETSIFERWGGKGCKGKGWLSAEAQVEAGAATRYDVDKEVQLRLLQIVRLPQTVQAACVLYC